MHYVFPGLHPFIERIAQATGRDVYQVGRTREVWHLARIQDSLGQLPRLDRSSQEAMLSYVRQIRESLALALEGADAAILEVSTELGLVPYADLQPVKKRINK